MMKKYRPILIFIAVVMLVLLFLTYYEPPKRDVLDGSIWKVVKMEDSPLVEGATLTIRFYNRKIDGSSGCNRFKGRYTLEDGYITIQIREETNQDCLNPSIMGQEREFRRLLISFASYVLNGNYLTLTTSAGADVVFVTLQ